MMGLRESITPSAAQTGFALRLSQQVGAAVPSGANFAFSPFSVHLLLALIAAGSEGRTRDQILSFLGLGDSRTVHDLNNLASQVVALVLADGSASGGPRILSANGVFFDSSLALKPSFKENVTNTFKAETKAVDFKTKAAEIRNEVNSWTETVTSGLIKELLPPGSVHEDTIMVLGNALYFKGSWTEKFDASETKDSEFHLLNGTSVQVPFMFSWQMQFLAAYDGFKVLRLPYEHGKDKRRFSMYIFLPDARDGLWSLEKKLSSEFELLTQYLPVQMVEVGKFKLPKFKITFGFEASAVLKDMGLVSPFSEDADITQMVDSPVARNLYVSKVFHKSFVEVNEEGTEAAAASDASMECGCSLEPEPIPPPLDFEADHPFMFLIREEITGVLLFTGHVLNPSLSG